MPHPDMNANNEHPDEGLLHEWLDEQLAPQDAAEMQAHVDSCAECQAAVAEARGLIAASHRILSKLDDVPAGVIPPKVEPTNDLDAARVAAENRSKSATKKSGLRWQRIASIAAVFVAAVIAGKSLLESDGKIAAPAATVANESAQVAESTDALSATDARAASAKPRLDAAKKATSDAQTANSAATSQPRPELATVAVAPSARARALDETNMVDPNAARAERERSARGLAEIRSRVQAPAQKSLGTAVASVSADSQPTARTALPATTVPAPPGGSPPILTAEQMVASSVAGGARGAAANTPPPPAAMQARVTNAQLSGKTADASASVQNAPAKAAGATMVSAGGSGTRIIVRDSSGIISERERSFAQQKRVDSSSAVQQGQTQSQTSAQLPLQGSVAASRPGAFAGAAATSFDSVTWTRTTCNPVCESSSVHVNTRGVVRYTVGEGNSQKVAMSQLTEIDRNQLTLTIANAFPNPARTGRLQCTVADNNTDRSAGQPPAFQLFVDYPRGTISQPNQPCTRSTAEVRALGTRIDAIVNADDLRRKIPRE